MLFKYTLLICTFTLSNIFVVNSTPILNAERIGSIDAPWHFQIVSNGTKLKLCGGTLISKKHILTAASCNFIDDTIKYHQWNEIIFQITRYTKHPNYVEGEANYDVAVLTFIESVQTSDELKVIRWNQNTEVSVKQKTLQLIGAGARERQRAYGIVVEQDVCNTIMLDNFNLIANSSICVEYAGGASPESTDIGSGVCTTGIQNLLIGVHNKVYEKPDGSGMIGMSIRTAFVAEWILAEMGEGAEMCFDRLACE